MGTEKFEHKYAIEPDILATSGETALRKIGEKGNIIYVDFDEIERSAEDRRNKDQLAFEEVLNLINETCDFQHEAKRAIMPTGGVISWDKPEGNVEHITRSASIKSRLKRQGKQVVFPRFLIYGHEVLNQGIIDVQYPGGDLSKIMFEDILKYGLQEDNLMNNQFIRVNNRDDRVLRLDYKLNSNPEKTRFSLAEDQDPKLLVVNPHDYQSRKVPGFNPRNLEQKLAFTNATRDDVEVHIITGGSGSGKSVTAYAAAVNHILGTGAQRKAGKIKERIILFKSNDIIGGRGREEGFLPGTTEEKNWPFMKSYKDAHDLIGLGKLRPFGKMLSVPEMIEQKGAGQSKGKAGKKGEKKVNKRPDNKLGEFYLPAREAAIEVEQLIYARGRTFENCVIFIDEAQNYTPFEMKQLVERAGTGSVIYLVGDVEQIDNPRLNKDYNGLTYAANIFFAAHPRFSMVNLDKNYRLQAAEIMRSHKAPRD